jgi:predicted amino acid-binding ACT domain protein
MDDISVTILNIILTMEMIVYLNNHQFNIKSLLKVVNYSNKMIK